MNHAEAATNNLRHLLRPIQSILDNPAMTDLYINGVGDGNAFVDVGEGLTRITVPYSYEDLELLAINAAALTRQDLSEANPVVEARFPPFHRVQIIRPPSVPDGSISFSVRQPKALTPTPESLDEQDVYSGALATGAGRCAQHAEMVMLYRTRQWRAFLQLVFKNQMNVVFSGRVGSGKTHQLRAYTHAIPKDARVVTIEDTRELINLPCENVVHLLYSKGRQSAARVTATDLVECSLRMGMDCLIFQELRDDAAYAFLNVLKSGHWGITTTHANTGADVYARICGLVMQHESGSHMNEAELLKTLHQSIDVIVHCVKHPDGTRKVEQVLWEAGLRNAAHDALAAD